MWVVLGKNGMVVGWEWVGREGERRQGGGKGRGVGEGEGKRGELHRTQPPDISGQKAPRNNKEP